MLEQALLDNDVALKVACYSLVGEMIAVLTVKATPPAMLGVGRFVIRRRLERSSKIVDVDRAKAAFARLLDVVTLLEPDDEELSLAAHLETEAARRNLELDGGESQLLAILARRRCGLLVTGDKRAIAAMALIAHELAANRVVCLEQLMVQVIDLADIEVIRSRICGEPLVDRAITVCFACSSATATREDVFAGLTSYISHLDCSAPSILVADFGRGRQR